MKFGADLCQDLPRALDLEWLEPNGRGGFASGTVAGPNTRRYHALLLVARRPPVDRVVLVNHLEEWATLGESRVPLTTNLYPGAVHPEGYRNCEGFALAPWPTWTYQFGGGSLRREICCVHGRDLVIVRWTVAGLLPSSLLLTVRPMLTGRDYHATHHENGQVNEAVEDRGDRLRWQPYADLPAVHAVHRGRYQHAPEWFRHVQFPVEHARGLDGEEDWWSPGEFTWMLAPGQSATLVLTTEADGPLSVPRLLASERVRRRRVAAGCPSEDPLAQALWSATDAYLCERDQGQTIVAGYPWFADWGRDIFLALPGLCFVPGRFRVAKRIIKGFASQVSQGMIPNRFPDRGESPEYNTIDASLWFVHAVGRYLASTKDLAFVRRVAWPAVRDILAAYRRGTRYGIRMTPDGLVAGGEPGIQLTWMDAKVGEWVVTPRYGKPVEVQALWIRALEVAESLATRVGEPSAAGQYREDAQQARQSFRDKFWYEPGGYLYDVIDGPDGDDASLRPNQLFALSLVDELLPLDQMRRILQVARSRLLTPCGVRTLDPDDPRYCPRYEGGPRERDGAYHQGTAWPFLLGPFITAWIKVFGATATIRKEARCWLQGVEAQLWEAGLGQVSEIVDAEPPHRPRGCVAQAWSVAEVLRVLIEDLNAPRPSTGGRAVGGPATQSRRSLASVSRHSGESKRTSRSPPRSR